jgi:glycosyltransferase involved in cell wall biosynthesis
MKIACVIPAYNEAANIAKTIEGVKGKVDEIIIVDDCSSDKTAEIAKKSGVKTIEHPINRGQGAALETGTIYALENGADIIVHFDADGQFLAEEIADIVKPIIDGQADLVSGSRFLGKEANFPFWKKNLIMPLGKAFNYFCLGIKLSDPQNGFRALNRRAASLIRIENRGMAHVSEIQLKAARQQLRIKEVPVTVIYHHFGQKLSGGFRIITDLLINRIIK